MEPQDSRRRGPQLRGAQAPMYCMSPCMQIDARRCRRVTGFNFGLHDHFRLLREVLRLRNRVQAWFLVPFLRLMFGTWWVGDVCGIRLVVCSVRGSLLCSTLLIRRRHYAETRSDRDRTATDQRPGLSSDLLFGKTLPGPRANEEGLSELNSEPVTAPVPGSQLTCRSDPGLRPPGRPPRIKTKQNKRAGEQRR